MADKRISQLVDRGTVVNNDVVPIVVFGAATTNKATISSIQTFMQGNLDLGVTSVGITLGSAGTDVSVTGSPITTSGNITINIPTASATARGLVSTAAQTFAGAKTFQNQIEATSGITLGVEGSANPTIIRNSSASQTSTSGFNSFGFNNSNNIYFNKGTTLNAGFFVFNNTAARTYTLPDATGTIALTSQLDGYVTLNTVQTITAQKTFTGGGSSDSVIISHGSGSGFALDVIKAGNGDVIRVNKTSGSGNAMTVIGGNFEAPTIVKTGGTSVQYLMADGSVSTLTNPITGTGDVNTVPKFTGTGTIGNSTIRDLSDQVAIGKRVSIDNGASQSINITPGLGGVVNEISTAGTLPLRFITSGSSITLAAGGTTPQFTLSSAGAVTLTGALNGTSAVFSGGVQGQQGIFRTTVVPALQLIRDLDVTVVGPAGQGLEIGARNGSTFVAAGAIYGNLDNPATNGSLIFNTLRAGTLTNALILASTGAATFSSSVTAASASFTGKLSVTQASTDFVAEIVNTQNATPYGLRIKDASSGANGYPLLSVSNNSGSVEYFRVNSGTGAATFSSSVTAAQMAVGNTSFNGVLSVVGNAATNGLTVKSAGNSGTFPLRVTWASGTDGDMLCVNDAGNVGIGTATPSAGLEIVTNGSITNALRITSNQAFNADPETAMMFRYRINASSIVGGALINCVKDNNTENNQAGNLQFWTNNGSSLGERMRITSVGQIRQTTSIADWSHVINNSSLSPNGILIDYTGAAPNNASNNFLFAADTSTLRFAVRANGGISNFQGNDTNLSDERVKKDIEPLESYWDKFKAIEIVKFKYKDQTHDDFNIGVIAQQVEAVAPEFVDVDGWDTKPKLDEEGNEIVSEEEPLKSVYTSDLHHATIKVLQEAMQKIENLQEQIDSLKNQIK